MACDAVSGVVTSIRHPAQIELFSIYWVLNKYLVSETQKEITSFVK